MLDCYLSAQSSILQVAKQFAFGCRVEFSDQIASFLQNYSAEGVGMWLGMLDKTLQFLCSLFPSLFFFFKQQSHLQSMLSVN